MYLIIGVWGGDRRIYAAYKFFLYTLLGSVLFLLAILYHVLHHFGTRPTIPTAYERALRICSLIACSAGSGWQCSPPSRSKGTNVAGAYLAA